MSLAEFWNDHIQKTSAQEASISQRHFHQEKQIVRLVAHCVAQKAAAGRRERDKLAIAFEGVPRRVPFVCLPMLIVNCRRQFADKIALFGDLGDSSLIDRTPSTANIYEPALP